MLIKYPFNDHYLIKIIPYFTSIINTLTSMGSNPKFEIVRVHNTSFYLQLEDYRYGKRKKKLW